MTLFIIIASIVLVAPLGLLVVYWRFVGSRNYPDCTCSFCRFCTWKRKEK